MIQRNSGYERQGRDLYETPIWVSDVIKTFVPTDANIWEPACASGKMAKVLRASKASDLITDYGETGINFCETSLPEGITAIITNPPFGKNAERFIRHGLSILGKEENAFMAMLLPVDFDSAKTRRDMFAYCNWFAGKIVLTTRIVWFEPAISTPSANHAWFMWDKRKVGQPKIYYHFNKSVK